MKKLISIVSGCFNEEENIESLYARITSTIHTFENNFNFELIFIDNSSTDNTQNILRCIAARDSRVKVIFNTRNFGHIRSPYWGILQSSGDATIYMASDLQDPPEKIQEFISEWEKGWLVVLATKKISETNFIFHRFRRMYYKFLNTISNLHIVEDATGFGLYDKKIVEQLKKIKDPYPFLRGIIAELGYPVKRIEFMQPKREKGLSKNNFYTLYDIGILGIISHSLVPIRLATLTGFLVGIISIIIAMAYVVAKLIYWNSFTIGIAPVVAGLFFLMGMALVFLGVIGEYIANIQGYVRGRSLVVEQDRINF
jgi:glycosyltransferase involved in cell wall biosynthesis